MLAGYGLFGLALFALWIYCIFDVISTDDSLARNLPRTMWLLIVIFIPSVGSIAWLALGRPVGAGYRPGDTQYRAPRRVYGPEDDPAWTSRTSLPPPSPPPNREREEGDPPSGE